MKLKQARREHVKLRVGLSSPSGFGKTYSALLLAYGIAGDYSKIAVIDTESSSASLYAHMGNFNVIELDPPYSPERYIEAIKACEESGMEVIIIDSISHEWNGAGGCLSIHEKLGGRFQDWSKVTPRHQGFIDTILGSNAHVITTTRTKVDYSMDRDSSGKTVVNKHGLKEITREGWEYELTLNFELINDNHLAKATKDRTGLFMNKPAFVINAATGRKLKNWCQGGSSLEDTREAIAKCDDLDQLRKLYGKYGDFNGQLTEDFRERKQQLTNRHSPEENHKIDSHAQFKQ